MLPESYNPVLRLGPATGRDFVVGDIHGCFHMLFEALVAVQFDGSVDRLISVGDLVDRGPQSPKVLEYLAQPWFYAVKGNHEEMLLDVASLGGVDLMRSINDIHERGAGWWFKVPHSVKTACIEAFSLLPVAIEIETPDGVAAFVHADVPEGMAWPQFASMLTAEHKAATMVALWSRERALHRDTTGVPGAWRVFVGHTPQPSVRCLGNVCYVDTGAVYSVTGAESAGKTLSLVEVGTPIGTPGRTVTGHITVYTR